MVADSPTGMVHDTGEATERFLRSAAKGEVDAAAARRQSVEAGKARAAAPPAQLSVRLQKH